MGHFTPWEGAWLLPGLSFLSPPLRACPLLPGAGRSCPSPTLTWSCLPQSRLVVKTALKLLLVFVEFSENNAPLFIRAVNSVASANGQILSLPPHHPGPSAFCPWVTAPLSVCRHSPMGPSDVHPAGEERG